MIPRKAKTLLKLVIIPTFLVMFVTACGQNQEYGKPEDGKQEDVSVTIPSVYSYNVAGKDKRGSYTGKVNIYSRGGRENAVTVHRSIKYKENAEIRTIGVGTLENGKIEIRLDNAVFRPKQKFAQQLTTRFEPKVFQRGYLSGFLGKDKKGGKVLHRWSINNKATVGEETWTFDKHFKTHKITRHKLSLKGTEWTSVPVAISKPGMIKISSLMAVAADGIFLKKGEKIPELKKPDETHVFLPFDPTAKKHLGAPSNYDEKNGAVWHKEFKEKDLDSEWVFYYRDRSKQAARKLDIVISYFDFSSFLPWLCDPWVDVDISPNEVAVGAPINIRVNARALSGLDMYWWFGNGTGITDLDKAHTMSGGGSSTGDYTWTIQIDQPGTYSFGANARDVLYWTDPGTPHQASEGCGLAYDVVTVRPVQKSYSVAFIVLAPEGTDTTTSEFQAHLNKVEDIKTALTSQFVTSTEGRGIVDVSYPIIVLTPPGPVYGLSDGGLMWTFLRETMVNHFYTAHPDDFDFLAIYELYPDKSIGSRHLTTKTKVAGFGITPYDISASWGSGGRLRGVGLVTDLTNLPNEYEFIASRMHLLLHEVFGHQWGVFADRIMKPGFHFDIGIESPNFTVLYGRPWRMVDETHFTTEDVQDPATGTFKVTFHPWMLYVAGMKTRSEVPILLMDVEPDTPPSSRYDLVTTTGTYENITLQSVIDQSGDRYDVAW